jgi:hypothetical protein
MTARDTIATNVHAAWCREPNHEDCDGVDEVDERVADAVIAAVRGMPVEDQAELIGAEVTQTVPDRGAMALDRTMTATLDTTVITQPGVYDLPADVYHADPVPAELGGSLSSSGAKLLLPPSCPAIYQWARTHPTYSDAFDFGHAAHKKVLGAGAEIVAGGRRRLARQGGPRGEGSGPRGGQDAAAGQGRRCGRCHGREAPRAPRGVRAPGPGVRAAGAVPVRRRTRSRVGCGCGPCSTGSPTPDPAA